MTITKALKDQPSASTNTDLDLFKLDPAKFDHQGTENLGRGRSKATYLYNNGSTAFDTIIEITTGKAVVNKILNCTAQIKVFVTQTSSDSVTGLTEASGQAQFWQGFSVPDDGNVLSDDVAKWLEVLLGIWFPTITAGVADSTKVMSAMRGTAKLY